MKLSRRVQKVFISISAPLLIAAACFGVIAFYNTFHKPPEVDILKANFATHHVEISEGEAIHFVNRTSSVIQFLCVGTDMHCDSFAYRSLQLPPANLQSPGIRIAPDQAKDVIFDTDGTFHITSTVVPGMNLTVTVDATAS